MDLKGLAWIGNIYEKFEAMCLEMEEVMYQDTVKYVENQVQTVGAGVKRFYSEVMQDVNPESQVDPVKVSAGNSSLNPYTHLELKRKTSAKKDAFENSERLADDYKVISGINRTGVYKRPIARKRGHSSVNNMSPVHGTVAPIRGNVTSMPILCQRKGSHEAVSRSLDVTLSTAAIERISGEGKEKMCNKALETNLPQSGASVDSPIAEPKLSMLSTVKKEADSELSSSNCFATENSASSCTSCEAEQAIKGDGGSSRPVEDGTMMSHKERLDGCRTDAAKNNDVPDQEVEIIENNNESALAETCVLVEEDMLLHYIHQGNVKHKSYKKKLREVFLTKKRSTRKEYEMLAAQFRDEISNQKSAETQRSVMCEIKDSNTAEVHQRDCPESEWEIL